MENRSNITINYFPEDRDSVVLEGLVNQDEHIRNIFRANNEYHNYFEEAEWLSKFNSNATIVKTSALGLCQSQRQ